MIDGLPWPAALGITAGGWALAGSIAWLVVHKIVSGDLVPSRILDAVTDRARRAEEANAELLAQNAELLDALRVSTALMEALGKAAER